MGLNKLTNFVTFSLLPILVASMMVGGMLRCSHQFKIFSSIVIFYFIFMMNRFIFSQISTYLLFHDIAVFQNVTILLSMGMFWLINQNISSLIFPSSTAPLRMLCSCIPCSWNFSAAFQRANVYFPTFNMRWTSFKFFFTDKTFDLYWFISHGLYYHTLIKMGRINYA